jgi:uncharacterized protein (DUF433 family)
MPDERIILDPAILAGKPVVRGTRLSVEFIIGLMAATGHARPNIRLWRAGL